MNALNIKAKKQEPAKSYRSILERVLDLFCGFDFFVCYTWADGSSYAKALANALNDRGFACFLDLKDYFPGDDLKQASPRALRKSKNLVLVGTPLAKTSRAVNDELRLFSPLLRKRRKIIPIDLGGCPHHLDADHPFFPYIPNTVLRIRDPGSEAYPSTKVIDEIQRAFSGTRQYKTRIRLVTCVAAVLLLLLVLVGLFHVREIIANHRAQSRLATATWLTAQGARDSSPIKAAHYFLASAEALQSIRETEKYRDTLLAAQHDSESIRYSWIQGSPVLGCVVNADKSRILSWGADAKIRIFNTNSPICYKELDAGGPVLGASFNSDGSEILSWNADGYATVWRLSGDSPPFIMKHKGIVNGATFDSSNDRVLVWGGDACAELWNVSTHGVIKVFRHEELIERKNPRIPLGMGVGFMQAQLKNGSEICSASISRDGSLVLTAGTDATARIWTLTNDAPLKMFEGSAAFRGTKFSGSGNYCVFWGDSELIWCQIGKEKLLQDSHVVDLAGIKGVEFDERHDQILTWTQNGIVNSYELSSGELIHSFQEEGAVNGACFGHGGDRILCWGDTGNATVWSTVDEKKCFEVAHAASVTGATLDASDQFLLTWSDDGSARLWNLDDGTPIQSYRHEGAIHGAISLPEKSGILTWGEDGLIRLWASRTGNILGDLNREGSTLGAEFLPGQSEILTWNATGGTIWNAPNSSPIWAFKQENGISGLSVNPQGGSLISWGLDGAINAWSPPTKHSVRNFVAAGGGVDGISMDNDCKFLIAWNQDGIGAVWDVRSGSKIGTFVQQDIIGAHFAPKGDCFLTWNTEGSVQVWQVFKSSPISVFEHEGLVSGAEWKADATEFVTWGLDGTTKVWSLDKAKPPRILKHSKAVIGAQFSADGKLILTWSLDNTAKLWSEDNGRELKSILHTRPLKGAEFHSDMKSVWTWTDDGTLRLWSGSEPARVFHHPAPIRGIQIISDGRHFLTWSSDSCARYWAIDRGEPICVLRHGGSIAGAEVNDAKTAVLTWNNQSVKFWKISVDDNISVRERRLELEIRSGAVVTADGDTRVLSTEEIQKREQELAKLLRGG